MIWKQATNTSLTGSTALNQIHYLIKKNLVDWLIWAESYNAVLKEEQARRVARLRPDLAEKIRQKYPKAFEVKDDRVIAFAYALKATKR